MASSERSNSTEDQRTIRLAEKIRSWRQYWVPRCEYLGGWVLEDFKHGEDFHFMLLGNTISKTIENGIFISTSGEPSRLL
jgi:hypothetical protein